LRAPEFWYRQEVGLGPRLLAPLSATYALVARARFAAVRPWRSPVPVVCIGNLVVGGAGKTPVAISLGGRLAALGRNVHFVSRGHGGRLAGPLRVDPARHRAAEVGDEPLLLAEVRPTWISRNRPAGIRCAAAAGADLVVLDDGFQNPGFAKDLSLVVVDGRRGFGNGRVLPLGPLREPVADGLLRAQAAVIVGADETGAGAVVTASGLPLLAARLRPDPPLNGLAGQQVVAFAGIGDPEKFFRTLEETGCSIVARHAFPDHHPYTEREVAAILDEARRSAAVPVTTAKDARRLPDHLRNWVNVLPVGLQWGDEAAVDRVVAPLLNDGR
jgi:tetraacyldisaccharide 4'-kinase